MKKTRKIVATAMSRAASWIAPRDENVDQPAYLFRGSGTTLELYLRGLGDRMIARQIGQAFNRYLEENGDPGLGQLVLTCGGYGGSPVRGDFNLYWWWSFGPREHKPESWLEHYVDSVKVPPDVILCPSERTLSEASEAGFRGIYLPLAVGPEFYPLALERSGLGYAGNPAHHSDAEENSVVEPYRGTKQFEWVSDIETPAGLNLWYNTKLITFGMTLPGQREWGLVNNRVFEALASGTPFIISGHNGLEKVLGFEYPFQTSGADETRALVGYIRNHRDEVLERCAATAKQVREQHTYTRRLETLFEKLEKL